MRNHYLTLDLPTNATRTDIQEACKNLDPEYRDDEEDIKGVLLSSEKRLVHDAVCSQMMAIASVIDKLGSTETDTNQWSNRIVEFVPENEAP